VKGLALLALTAGLSGCAVGPDYAPISMPTPLSFIASKGQNAQGAHRWVGADLKQWWRSFRDPELNSLVERAIEENYDIEVALTRLEQAQAAVLASIGAALPSGVAGATASGGTGNDVARSRVPQELISAVNTTGFSQVAQVGGLAAGWDLDIFGKHRREIEAAQYDAEAAADDREGVLINVVADVARAYFDLRAAEARLAVARQSIEAARRNLELVQNRAAQGITNDLDVTLAQRELSTFQSTVPPLEAEIETSKYLIAILLGKFPQDLVAELAPVRPIPTFPARISVGTPLDLLQRRPDIQEAERSLAAATARIGVATAALYPDIAVTGAAGGQGGSVAAKGMPITAIGAVGPLLYWPVLDFGTLDAQVEIADYQMKEQLVRYRRTVLQAVEQVEEAVAAFRAQQDRLRELDVAIAAGKQAVKLSSERYDRGLTDFLNVLDAERQEYELQAEYVSAQQTSAEQLIGLYKALGGGWEAYQNTPAIPPAEPAIPAAIHRALAPKAPPDPRPRG
jgi:NodT family efflux transporter outer membrane factor (OMF) lipoprotein